MASSTKLPPGIVEVGAGSLPRLERHRNPGLEIVYVAKGHLRWEVEGQEELVAPDSVFFTLPWQEHGSALETEPGHEWHYVILDVAPDRPADGESLAFHAGLGLSIREQKALTRTFLSARKHAWHATAMLAWLVPELVREVQKGADCSPLLVRGLATACLAEMAHVIVAEPRRPYSLAARRVEKLLKKLADHPEEAWTLAGMAAECQLRRTRFSQVFTTLTGEPPVRHLNRLRIDRAKADLRDTDKAITRIAHECGFSSSQYFAKVFRSFEGCDARAWRRKHRGE